jgi:hypothetical protein
MRKKAIAVGGSVWNQRARRVLAFVGAFVLFVLGVLLLLAPARAEAGAGPSRLIRMTRTDANNRNERPTARKEPDGRCALLNSSFLLPLKEGDNDVVIALANHFYGWGIEFRLEDVEGIRLAE